MASLLEHFDFLVDKGIKVIPVRENSKIPISKKWNIDWNQSLCRNKLSVFPDSNIGILLGDIVDVEGDSEHANKKIADIIGDYPHPSYYSKKSTHHLFLNPGKIRWMRVNEIEFRGYGHQSILPPSKVKEAKYIWKNIEFPVPEMPKDLLLFYMKHKNKKSNSDFIKPGHIKVWCSVCRNKCFLNKSRFSLELEIFRNIGLRWQCKKCRTIDTKKHCRVLKHGNAFKVHELF